MGFETHQVHPETDPVDAVFGPGGLLAEKFDGYKQRPGQVALSRAVFEAIEARDHLVAEGGTGIGKSFAYLVPAIHYAVTQGKRILVATANIALQEQLVEKDLPLLREILPWEFRFTIFKGKGNYLCESQHSKALVHQAQPDLFGQKASTRQYETGSEMDQLLAWAQETTTGDKSELDFVPNNMAWSKLSVGADDCKGKRCRFYKECWAVKARTSAEQCHIVVCNYHLLFANLKYMGAVLPPFDVAILDEAHEAADIARDFLGFRVGSATFRRLARRLKDFKLPHEHIETIGQRYFERLRLHHGTDDYSVRLRQPDVVHWRDVDDVLEDTIEALRTLKSGCTSEDAKAEIDVEVNRAKNAQDCIQCAMKLDDDNHVCFIEVDKEQRTSLHGKPIKVSGLLREGFFHPTPTVILTSATLSVEESFDHLCDEIGVTEPRELIAESPFSADQSLLILPSNIPDPRDREWPDALAEGVIEVIRSARGRTLCLFTSWRVLNQVYDQASKKLRDIWIYKQGDQPRTKLIAEFKKDVDSVLMGTRSFWAGVDVPGESLSCVVIDKLPFTTPNDPILNAVQSRIGRSAFYEFSIPRSIIAFKQGVGRLIRSVDDRGVVVCFDNRLVTKGYGKMYIRSLPDMKHSNDLDDVWRFLKTQPLGLETTTADEDIPF